MSCTVLWLAIQGLAWGIFAVTASEPIGWIPCVLNAAAALAEVIWAEEAQP